MRTRSLLVLAKPLLYLARYRVRVACLSCSKTSSNSTLTMPKTLDEPDVGISCFVSSLPGFRAVLKHRYSDFIVNEVSREGEVVHLTSFDLPQECINIKPEDESNSNDRDYSTPIESFRILCGDADAEALKVLLEKISSGSDTEIDPIILSPDSDKLHRSDVHNFFKKNFNFFITDTVEGPDDKSKCIRVRFSSGQSGKGGSNKRGKKRKGVYGTDREGGRFDSRGSDSWHLGKFVRFHLYKENKDTQEALGVIGKMLGIQTRGFGFAGTKDKRSVSTQQVTVFKVHPKRLAVLNDRLFGIKIGNICYVKEGLVLGQLKGNHFTITLRDVVGDSEEVITNAADGLGKYGFINYFGLQRFGSGPIPTHLIGAILFRGEWKSAVDLILNPREGEREAVKEVREHYTEDGDIDEMLRNLPRYLVAERSILQCLKKCPGNYLQALKAIPRTLRMMYVHSYQSYLWNHAVSLRVQKYGISQVVVGDLVYCKDSLPEEGTVIDSSEIESDAADAFLLDASSESQPEEKLPVVKVVDHEDISKGAYTFEDVVLPLPGSRVIYPDNEVASIYHEMAEKDGISLTESAHGVKEFSITSMTGGYRRVYQRPVDYTWEMIKYKNDNESLAQTDLDIITGKVAEAEKKDESTVVEGSHIVPKEKLALKLGFTLPPSSYATMAIRELLKSSSLAASQKINP
ncbi:Pseudouridylate synthase 7-like protein [Rhynchospora pubera]|uniref:Pseudouridylate synthase 7-like protein n=1 Tax=Rhynchospora pubera TaxID=906938 RepID=A0AAV8D1G5_9POAL|nr:Pseudouridylate synthase 7-like protein [Rhynchospora pubera]